ncbi:MAG: DUF2065 family protein [Candidatus Diapherotrites archaeon]|nr:DUF2065 family protein [Candidatus Diapherotrites archaeon]
MDYVVLIIGLAALTKGLPYFFSPETARKRLRKWLKYDDLTYRMYGAIALSLGAAIIFIGLF